MPTSTTLLKKFLRRYTNLPALIYLLRTRQITLLDPESWDDSNDSHYLSLYREKKKLKSVLALCFTQASETYHHWRVYSSGSSGVCIEFNRNELLRAVRKHDVRAGKVTYRTIRQMQSRKPRVDELPFLKRHAFRDDIEFRVIYESKRKELPTLDIPVALSSINRITLSPWLNPLIAGQVKRALWSIQDCRKLDIARSTLVSNEEWKVLGGSAP
jgi:hypothetical protein